MQSKNVVAATKALQKFLATQKEESGKADLFEETADDKQFIYLHIKARHYFASSRGTKPHLVTLPHSIWEGKTPSICILTRDPQRAYKDALQNLDGKPDLVERVVGVSKLKGKFKPYEARRALKSDHDIFLAEEDIVPMLPKLLGTKFYSSQFSIPISVRVRKHGKISAKRAESQIGKIKAATAFVTPASTLLNVRIGHVGMKPQHIAANAKAVIEFIENQFKEELGGFKMIGLKTDESPLLPVYYAEKVYTESDIGEEDDLALESAAKKRKREMAELDQLLEEVVDKDEIKAYNREQRAKRKQRVPGSEKANDDAEAEAEQAEA